MAYEFKKLSDVEVLETTTEATNILAEENGEIVKTNSNNFKTGLLKTPYDDYANEDGTIPSVIVKNFFIIDGSAYGVPLNNYNQYTAAELIEYYRKGYIFKNFERSVMLPTGNTPRFCTKYKIVKNSDNTTYSGIFYFGDDIAPIIANEADNSFILDPDWVAPAEPIPAPATAEIGQVVAVKAVDESGKPTEWEAVGGGSGGETTTIYYAYGAYLYTDEELTVKASKDEVIAAFAAGSVRIVRDTQSVSGYYYNPVFWKARTDDEYAQITFVVDSEGSPDFYTAYSAEYVDAGPS